MALSAKAPPHSVEPVPHRRTKRLRARLSAPLAIGGGAVALRLIAGVGFANYDTLYALVWGQQLSRGETPQYAISIAPTPHPLVEALGLLLSPLGPRAVEHVMVALGFLALAACGWVLFRLGSLWFGRLAGALAALILLTRVPVLSYGVRAYVDIPYLLLVLCALLVECRRRHAGTPVLALLALAGLLRPEAWVFSGLYWMVYALHWQRARVRVEGVRADARTASTMLAPAELRSLVGLALLAAAAPLAWALSDLLVTGHPLWSLTHTRHTATALDRITGLRNVPEYIPRRIGEILRPPVLVGAALGGVLSLLWLPRREVRLGAIAGLAAVLVFAVFATAGLPINTRYAFLTAAILCLFCGAGVFGWTLLEPEDPRRRWWMLGGVLVAVALLLYTPAQYRSAHRELQHLARQQSIQNDLTALVEEHAIALRCGPVGVPNHRPVPLLALGLHAPPSYIVSAQVRRITAGTYVDPASPEVERTYTLDPHDTKRLTAAVPPGFAKAHHANRSWLLYERCR
jgi:hypothetical protein